MSLLPYRFATGGAHRRHGLATLVVGAGDAGRTLARDMLRSPDYGLCPIGFLDDVGCVAVGWTGCPCWGRWPLALEEVRAPRIDVIKRWSSPYRRFLR